MADPSSIKSPETDPKERLCRKFQAEATAIQEQIAQLTSFSAVGGERQDAFEHILAAISRFSREVADAADVLSSYDFRTYTQVVRALAEQANEANAKLAPKARFRFKAKSPGGGAGTSTVSDQALRPLVASAGTGESWGHHDASSGLVTSQPAKSNQESPAGLPAHIIDVAGRTGEHIVFSVPAPAVRRVSAGVVKDVKRCVVDLRAATSGSRWLVASLALRDVVDSLVLAGDVGGSVHLTGLKHCVVVVVAKQVRLHECHNVDMYLHCDSHPIIEDCEAMRFAPAPASFLEMGTPSTNQWDQVDDFKWLKAGESPNWIVLPDAERIPDEAWKRLISNSSSNNKVEDMLGAAGITTTEALGVGSGSS